MKILIVEDDKDIAETLRIGLTSKSHIVELTDNGNDGSFMGRSFDYDIIVLDYSLPKKDGLAVCREIRAIGKTTPIIFLSIASDPSIKVAAFENGADDYMTKPFALEELLARMKVLSKKFSSNKSTLLKVHDLILDSDKNTVTRDNKRLQMTRKEFSILEFMMKHAGSVVSRASLLENVWTADSNPFSNTVEAHIRNLRLKLNSGNKPSLIFNVPGRGYVIDTPQNLKKLYG